MDSSRTARLEAYNRVRAIVDELRGIKLHATEADQLMWAAEGMLLAASSTDEDAIVSRTAFNTLLDELMQHRWAESGLTAQRLRDSFAACGPVSLGLAA